MSDHPIIFSALMVKALLDGRKTQTRRLARSSWASFGSAPKEYWDHADLTRARPMSMGGGNYLHMPCHVETTGVCARCDEMGWEGTAHRLWPTVNVGERLWVRERFALDFDGVVLFDGREPFDPDYRIKWRPSIHMPRAASRLALIVTGVKIERLQDISREDEIAEGTPDGMFFDCLWDNLHGHGSWEANPEVVAISFAVHRANIDALPKAEAA